MLVLARKRGERIVIGDEIEVTVLDIRGGRVKLGFQGPQEIPIHRRELHARLQNEPSADRMLAPAR